MGNILDNAGTGVVIKVEDNIGARLFLPK